MASLMCVDVDLNSDLEDADNDGCDVKDNKLDVMEIVEREVEKVKKEGSGAVVWLELEDLDIDDDVFLSLDLPSKFPVCNHSQQPKFLSHFMNIIHFIGYKY
jgi:tubulin--tyrosine ligase-like protein 12